MTTTFINEDAVEQIALDVLRDLGFVSKFGPDIAHDGDDPERSSYDSVLLPGRLRESLARINPSIPTDAREEVLARLSRPETPDLVENNRRIHGYLTTGVPVEYQIGGETRPDLAWLVDWDDPSNNDWLAVNQFTVEQDQQKRRPDIVIFLNGMPVAVIELKNPADANATVQAAYNQLQTYKAEIGDLFVTNGLLIVSDGAEARAGTLTSSWNWFLPWKTIDGESEAPATMPQMEVLLRGMFEPERLLDILRNFIVFEDERGGPVKKLAGYHQYHAVNKAIERTVEASLPEGDRRAGVVWHTQGSGKSLSMTFYAGKIVRHPAMRNPTLVMLTDRNDLDDQLFGVFARCSDLVRQTPVQAGTRAELRELLKRDAGGIIFTTIQKFLPEQQGDKFPELSNRRNIVVIADEAHRSQYDFIDGFARHMRDALPGASFVGFTGTPIESEDVNTPQVFGDYIDIYDIQRAVDDGSTVSIFYESRLAKLALDEAEKPNIDDEFDEATEGEELAQQERLKTQWAAIEKLVGSERRIAQVAEDLVNHWEQRVSTLDGKAMVVCMSRRICIELHDEIVKLRPDWYHKDDDKGVLKVVMTGNASEGPKYAEHARNKSRREALATRFKDPGDPFKVVLVRDMWLTGFDCPALDTMYVDKPMRGHALMQAIARVNRVFRAKQGGLVVDYIGLAPELKKALSQYTRAGGKGRPSFDQDEAVALMKDKYEIVLAMFHGFDIQRALDAAMYEKLQQIKLAANFILAGAPGDRESSEERKKRFLKASSELSKAFALAVPHEDAIEIRDSVGFIQAVRGSLVKLTVREERAAYEQDAAIEQILSKAVVPDGVIDIFAEAGLERPDISLLSDEFLAEVKAMPERNLAAEALQKLLDDEIKVRSRKNAVEARKFSKLLEESIRRYQNRTIEASEVILELIELAKAMQEADRRGEELGLTEDEVAFYDALSVNESAVEVLGDDALRDLAMELVETVRRNASIDWTAKESVRAKMRVMVRRLLRKYGYPPDMQAQATQTVLEQAALLGFDIAS